MTVLRSGEWRLRRRPQGSLTEDDFSWHEVQIDKAALGEGEVIVRTIYLSLDPSNRIWASSQEGYMPPVEIGEVFRGMTVGQVVAVASTGKPRFAVDDILTGGWGWREYAVLSPGDQKQCRKVPHPRESGIPLTAYMGLLSFTGATAYFGIVDVLRPKAGETFVVNAAAGAVGSIAGQIAKSLGCYVVGIAGADDKCAWLRELGFDATINYKKENVRQALKVACPKGIDCLFENVGGQMHDDILSLVNLHGRVALCGLIANYNATKPMPGPYNYAKLVVRRIKVQGFIILDYVSRFNECFAELGKLLKAGKIQFRVDTVDGLRSAPSALNRLFDGTNTGKLCVRVTPDVEGGSTPTLRARL